MFSSDPKVQLITSKSLWRHNTLVSRVEYGGSLKVSCVPCHIYIWEPSFIQSLDHYICVRYSIKAARWVIENPSILRTESLANFLTAPLSIYIRPTPLFGFAFVLWAFHFNCNLSHRTAPHRTPEQGRSGA